MIKFAANLNTLWSQLPYLDRFDVAADAGFDGVSVPFPYDVAAKETRRAVMQTGLPVVQISCPPPNYTGGMRGFAAVPELAERFKYDLRRALRYCQELRVPVVQIMAGVASGKEAHDTLIRNLQFACSQVADGVSLTLEPQAQEGAFLNTFDLAAEVISEVGAPNLGLQFHCGHAHVLTGDACTVFQNHADIVRHIQFSDAPGFGAPGTGDIDFEALMAAISGSGYDRWIVADFDIDGPKDTGAAAFLKLRE